MRSAGRTCTVQGMCSRHGGQLHGLTASADSQRTLQVTSTEIVLAAKQKRKFANAHAYHVNSIALSSDQETFITADDLRINLWNLEHADQAFNVVDMKPPNMEELTEVRHFCSPTVFHQCAGRDVHAAWGSTILQRPRSASGDRVGKQVHRSRSRQVLTG